MKMMKISIIVMNI